MAGQDVTDAFDTDFLEEFTLVRRAEVTGDNGRPTVTPTVIPEQYGVIDSASPNDLQRWPEADVSLKSVVIVTLTRLQLASVGPDADTTYKNDIVQWAGNTYEVGYLDDYSRYGEGYVFAIAQVTDYQLAAPTPNPVT